MYLFVLLFVFADCCDVCFLRPCGCLLGAVCGGADLLAFLYVMFSCGFCHFRIWCPGSGVLDCIDS